jgi:tetratricopeptide (TPR) repeat protein
MAAIHQERPQVKGWLACLAGAAAALQACAASGTRVDVENSRRLVQEALELFQADEYSEALKRVDLAIRENGNNHEAYVLRGMTRMRQIDHGDGSRYTDAMQKAFEDLNTAIRIYPMNFHAYYHRAVAYASVGKYEYAARDLVNHCLSLRPQDPPSNLLLAKVYDEGFVGQGRRALSYYEKYLKAAGALAEPWVLGRIGELKSVYLMGAAPAEDEKKAAQLYESAMQHVIQKNYPEAVGLLTELQLKFAHTKVAKDNERMLPMIIQAMKGDQPPPKDGKN